MRVVIAMLLAVSVSTIAFAQQRSETNAQKVESLIAEKRFDEAAVLLKQWKEEKPEEAKEIEILSAKLDENKLADMKATVEGAAKINDMWAAEAEKYKDNGED